MIILLRRDTSKNWFLHNPVLEQKEFVIEKDTNRIKKGDGVLNYYDLPYFLGSFKKINIFNGRLYVPAIIRRGSSIDANDNNILLEEFEPFYETDTDKNKIGDGRTKYKDLKYLQ